MKCLNCDSDLMQIKGKRKKIFCDSTCRSNYWQKSDRLEKNGLSVEQIVNKIKKSKGRGVESIYKEDNPKKIIIIPKDNPKINHSSKLNKMPSGLDKIAQLRWLRENQ